MWGTAAASLGAYTIAMSMTLDSLVGDEAARRQAFPVSARRVFLGHAGVAALPAAARDAIRTFADDAAADMQETDRFRAEVRDARKLGAELINADAGEIALIGPTSLGLSLVARGLDWQPGDQVIYYADDYPANVYPWMELARRGVEPVPLRTEKLGVITWDDIQPLLTERTRLVALATCNFLSGYAIDYAEIGRRLHDRGVLLCLDAIQTVGALPMNVEHVDFLAADSHKWMLGPIGAGLFYVARAHHERLRPPLVGAWNVQSPNFIAQDAVAFEPGGRRYEPGALNGPGIVGMAASMRLLLDVGIDRVATRLLELRHALLDRLRPLGFEPYIDEANTAIITVRHPRKDLPKLFEHLNEHGVAASLRHDRDGRALLRFSPHFYNTEEEFDRVARLMG